MIDWNKPIEGMDGTKAIVTMLPCQQPEAFTGCYDVRIGDIGRRTVDKDGFSADFGREQVVRNVPAPSKWAFDRVHELWGAEYDGLASAFARYIMSKEEPPVDPDLIEARLVAAETWYSGVKDAVMLGHYDNVGDAVPMALRAIKRGRALERGE